MSCIFACRSRIAAALNPRCMNLRTRPWSGSSIISTNRSRYGATVLRSSRTSSGAASTNTFIRSALILGSENSADTSS